MWTAVRPCDSRWSNKAGFGSVITHTLWPLGPCLGPERRGSCRFSQNVNSALRRWGCFAEHQLGARRRAKASDEESGCTPSYTPLILWPLMFIMFHRCLPSNILPVSSPKASAPSSQNSAFILISVLLYRSKQGNDFMVIRPCCCAFTLMDRQLCSHFYI